jgi:hypothetical protein
MNIFMTNGNAAPSWARPPAVPQIKTPRPP